MIRLEVIDGPAPDRGRVLEVAPGAQIVVGRAPSAQLQIHDAHLSGEHGLVFREHERYVYRDLRSTNGSIVLRGDERIVLDGEALVETPLCDGDQLMLGDAAAPVVVRCRIFGEQVPQAQQTQRVLAVRPLSASQRLSGELEHSPDVSLLYRALKRFSGRIELDEVLDAVVQAAFELAPGATHAAILLRDAQDPEKFTTIAARPRDASAGGSGPVMMSRALLGRVLTEHAAVLAADAVGELGLSESIMRAEIRSTIAVPLCRGGAIFGMIELDNRERAGIFTERDLERVLLLGEQAGLAIDNARMHQQIRATQERTSAENQYLRRREARSGFEQIIGQSPAMQQVFKQLERVLQTRVTVCIMGETGTGKELVASAIHHQGPRRERIFVAQNCAALPEQLLESELFGHKRGAFTGADSDRKGLFELADGGTLFLDEIGELPLGLQAKLLRVLQDGEVRPLGATRSRTVDVRIICATNRLLQQEIEAGRFRQDLYYRLMVFPIELPALRERPQDIPPLAQHFLRVYSHELGKAVGGISQAALDELCAYDWPGNIRELQNEMQRVVLQVDDEAFVEPRHLSRQIHHSSGALGRLATPKGTLKERLDEVERWLLIEALQEHGGNKTRTAKTLGITREGLHKKLNRFGIG